MTPTTPTTPFDPKDFTPLVSAAGRDRRCLVSEVRCGRAGNSIHLRISSDIIEALGWEDGARLAVLTGSGKAEGFVRFVDTNDAKANPKATRTKLRAQKGSRCRIIALRAAQLGLDMPSETLVLPHVVQAGGLTVDLNALPRKKEMSDAA